MIDLDVRLKKIKENVDRENITIMIIGLGSVGLYLLDYILSKNDSAINVVAAGRSLERMESDVNIVRVASLIRQQNKSKVTIAECDLNNPDSIEKCIKAYQPDFIVNSSRVYSGLKYGSISWHTVRAYGIWSPLAVPYIRNIMRAYDQAESNALVINTSYSDAVIPWLKSAGLAYPDFGSGNLNHLIPRIKYAAAEMNSIQDFWNLDVTMATSHFHDVVISKEGQSEGLDPLLAIFYDGKPLTVNPIEVYKRCKIAMPVDAKRNMMNASSNFDIIFSIIDALRNNAAKKFHSPGALGNIGGYPVCISGNAYPKASIDESVFSMDEMVEINKKSLALDGIESIKDGVLTYTDSLIEKTKKAFFVELPKAVPFDAIDETAMFIIEKIINKQVS